MKTVGNLLPSLFKNLGIEDRIKLSDLQSSWNTLFNEPLSQHTHPVDLKDGVLVLNVDSPAWRGELKFFKDKIVENLRSYDIKDIRFKNGRVYKKKNIAADSKRNKVLEEKNRPLTESEQAWIDETISNISDLELMENVKKAILIQMQRERLKK